MSVVAHFFMSVGGSEIHERLAHFFIDFYNRIENEGKKPSYDILYKLIRALSILPDQIFFPEKQIEDSEMESLVRMLYNCDERSMQIIKATVRAALDSQPKE